MSGALWIMIAGPWSTGARSEAARAANLAALNEAAAAVLRRGHVPVVGVNLALPVAEAAQPEHRDEIVLAMSLAIAERCDAVLRIGGASVGADEEVARIRTRGGSVFSSVEEIPAAGDETAR